MISVIIPARNEEERIATALAAVLKQDYPDYEVIVVDNGSYDATAEIAGSFPNVKVLHETRMGTMWACERGRSTARGDIIVRMDADCVPPPTWLSRGASHFADPRVTAVSGPYVYFDYSPLFRVISDIIQRYVYATTSALLQAFGSHGIIIGGNSFMRATAMDTIGGFDTRIVFYGDDTDIARKLSKLGRVVYDRRLILPSSARRFMKHGIWPIVSSYFKGFWNTKHYAQAAPERTVDEVLTYSEQHE